MTADDVRARLESDFHRGLLTASYQSILGRLQQDGYFPESLTGAYPGMYPRTVGALVRLLLETGQLDKAEKILDYCFTAVLENDLDRLPHIIGTAEPVRVPIRDINSTGCFDRRTHFAQMGMGLGAAQSFKAIDKPLLAVEIYASALVDALPFRVTIKDATGATVFSDDIAIKKKITSEWARIDFETPVKLKPSQTYRIEFRSINDRAVPILYAGAKPAGDIFKTAYTLGRDGSETPNNDVAITIIFDYGEPVYTEKLGRIGIISSSDQIDGQAHVIMAWAMLARKRGGMTEFANRTYDMAAKLMNRTTESPYLSFDTGWRCQPGLVCNTHLEHSRDGQFWHAYDFLSQSFVASALENMIQVAASRGDHKHVELWTARLAALNKNIAGNMTRDFNGKRIYFEMLLPSGKEPVPFEGIGWLNLAPIPAGWKTVDEQIFRDTIDTWHEVAVLDWDGPCMYSNDWLPDGMKDVFGRQHSRQIIGKVIGWDLVYCLQNKQYSRVCDMLDFLEQINTPPIYAEAFFLTDDGKWVLNDPGNGEQICWLTWGMTVMRQELGLPALP